MLKNLSNLRGGHESSCLKKVHTLGKTILFLIQPQIPRKVFCRRKRYVIFSTSVCIPTKNVMKFCESSVDDYARPKVKASINIIIICSHVFNEFGYTCFISKLALGLEIAKQLSGSNPHSLSNNNN